MQIPPPPEEAATHLATPKERLENATHLAATPKERLEKQIIVRL